jgi:hypothetical protein
MPARNLTYYERAISSRETTGQIHGNPLGHARHRRSGAQGSIRFAMRSFMLATSGLQISTELIEHATFLLLVFAAGSSRPNQLAPLRIVNDYSPPIGEGL